MQRLQRSGLERLSEKVASLVAEYLEAREYAQLLSASSALRAWRRNARVLNNSLFERMRFLREAVDERSNVLLMGPGGTGKTVAMNRLVQALERRGRSYALACPHAAACRNYPAARTIHSLFGLGKGTKSLERLKQELETHRAIHGAQSVPRRYLRLNEYSVFLIDEISLCGLRLWEQMDWVLRETRALLDPANRERPMGGAQLVVSGDFMQLQPVADSYCFTSPAWERCAWVPVVFTYLHRHAQDPQYAQMCLRVRMGQHTEQDVQRLLDKAADYELSHANQNALSSSSSSSSCSASLDARLGLRGLELMPDGFYVPSIVALHRTCDRINEACFADLPGPLLVDQEAQDAVYERVVAAPGQQAEFRPSDAVPLAVAQRAAAALLDHKLRRVVRLKHGMQLILTRNLDVERGHVNSSLCRYERLSQREYHFRRADFLRTAAAAARGAAHSRASHSLRAARAERDDVVDLAHEEDAEEQDGAQVDCVVFEDGSLLPLQCTRVSDLQLISGEGVPGGGRQFYLGRQQYALIPGYAITAHRSQGVTLKRARLDLRSVPFKNAAYVMLSRVRSWEGVQIMGFDARALRTHAGAKRKVAEILEQSAALAGP